MAQTLKIKRSTTTASPTTLENGELAYSANSNKLFIGRPGGTTGDIDAVGGKYFTDIIDAATNANTASTLVLRDASGNFSAGTITASLSGNATTASSASAADALSSAQNFSISGDVATSAAVSFDGTAAVNLAVTLPTVNADVGTFGSSSAIPVVTVNAKGQITAISTQTLGQGVEVNDLTASVIWANVPDANITQSSVTQHQAALSITESQISDFGTYLTSESNDLTASVTWANVPDANITQSSVTQHQAALSITESQISDFGTYQPLDADLTAIAGLAGTSGILTKTAADTWALDTNTYLTSESNDLTASVTWANVPDANITQSSVTQHQAALSITESQISDFGSYLTAESDTLDTVTGRGATTTNSVSFGDIETSTGNITGPATITIDPAGVGDATGTVVIAGDLTVQGTTTTVDSTTVAIGDNIIVLNKDEAGTPSANAGIEVERGTAANVAFIWNETSDTWQVTVDGSAYSNLLTVANFETQITAIDGGSF